jgi:hypothetical protein
MKIFIDPNSYSLQTIMKNFKLCSLFMGLHSFIQLNLFFNAYKESKEQCTCIKVFQLFEIVYKQSKHKITFTR